MTLRAFSFGGGVQSVAALVLATEGRIPYRDFVFANVGDDSENPATLAYYREHALPYAAAHGLTIHEVRYTKRDGTTPTLYEALTIHGTKDIPIPVWLGSGAPGNRKCTERWKIRVVARWLADNGATAARPAVLAMGISLDEIRRARTDSGFAHYTLDYPLLDLRLRRRDCVALIERAGLPVPPKSACWWCPYSSPRTWQERRDNEPDLFARAVALEATLNARRAMLGRDAVYLHSARKPLAVAAGNARQLDLFDTCESGFCFT